MSCIELGIALSLNAEAYLEFLLWTINVTVSDISRLKLLLGVNHGADRQKIETIAEHSGCKFEVFDANPNSQYSSDNHGRALDMIFQKMSGPCGMLVDVDIAFLRKDWDILLENQLNENNPIVGTEYDGQKYLGFPNVICAMFTPEILRKCNVSFIPEGNNLKIDNATASIYGRQPGDVILLDTGSELPRKLKAANLNGKTLSLHRESSVTRKFMTEGLRGEEYQLDGAPILTHIGRSYTRKFGVDQHAIDWERRVREWLQHEDLF